MYVHKIMYMPRYLCVHIIFISYLSCVEHHPTIEQLQAVMSNIDGITTHWCRLGQELLNCNDTLQVIEAEHYKDVNTCCHLMFNKWLEIRRNASWSRLVTALSANQLNTNTIIAGTYRYVAGTYIRTYLKQVRTYVCIIYKYYIYVTRFAKVNHLSKKRLLIFFIFATS